jgi:3-phenylpropionate/cinnamic acid dioxygenase small subunit
VTSDATADAVAAVHALLARYAECVDRADFDGVGELFAHATLRSNAGPDAVRGRDAVRALYAATNRLHADGTPRTHHLVTNVIVDVDGDAGRAAARSYFVAFQATPALPLQPIVAGRYHDAFERVDGRWRFAERMTLVDLVGDLSQYMAVDLDVASDEGSRPSEG